MKGSLKVLTLAVALASGPGVSTAQSVVEGIPDGPFKSVHFVKATALQEAAVAAEIRDLNQALSQAGCPTCSYHLFKLFSGPRTQYAYMVTAEWPGRSEYVRLHASPAFAAASRRSRLISDLSGSEIYGRYVEVQ
jgi:hypothetical protein